MFKPVIMIYNIVDPDNFPKAKYYIKRLEFYFDK